MVTCLFMFVLVLHDFALYIHIIYRYTVFSELPTLSSHSNDYFNELADLCQSRKISACEMYLKLNVCLSFAIPLVNPALCPRPTWQACNGAEWSSAR